MKEYPPQLKDLVERAVEHNDHMAQRQLGLMYDFGNEYVERDYKEALYWYRSGATYDPECSWRLAYFYQHGQGTEKDEQSALRLYKYSLEDYQKLSKEAEDYVRYAVAELEKKVNETFASLSVKAEGGDAHSQYLLAMMYVKHVVVPLDFDKIKYWMIKAADGGDRYAQAWLAFEYWATDYQFQRDLGKSFYYARCSALQGHPEGAYQLALCYQNGTGVPENEVEAFKWMKIAADKGHEMAMSSVGRYFAEGKGTAKNYELAVHYLKLYCQNDRDFPHGYEQYQIGYCYYYGGYGLKQNLSEALKWLNISAKIETNRGLPSAVSLLGEAYFTGTGVSRNIEKAVSLYKKADFLDDCFAAYKLAYLHFYGMYAEKSYSEALRYVKLADKRFYNHSTELRKQIDELKKQLLRKGYN